MPQPKVINKFGEMIGWTHVSVRALGRTFEGVTAIEYGDDDEINNEYGAGGHPQGYSKGNTSPFCNLTLFLEEIIGMQESLRDGQRLQDIAEFEIVVKYEWQNKIYTDIVNACKIKNNGRSVSQGDGTVSKQFNLRTAGISYNQ